MHFTETRPSVSRRLKPPREHREQENQPTRRRPRRGQPFPVAQLFTQHLDLLSTAINETRQSARTAFQPDCFGAQELADLEELGPFWLEEKVVSARSRRAALAATRIQQCWRAYRQRKCLALYQAMISSALTPLQTFSDSSPQDLSLSSEPVYRDKYTPRLPENSEVIEELARFKEFEVRKWSEINLMIQQSMQDMLDEKSLLEKLVQRTQENRKLIESGQYRRPAQFPDYQREDRSLLSRFFKDSYEPEPEVISLIERQRR